MKRLLVCILIAVLMLSCLTACDVFDGLFGMAEGVSCKKYENCAVFTFCDFEERTTASFELDRVGLGEGAIYYQVNLKEGALSINYKDTGLIHKEQPFGEFTADDEMPINGSGGYIEGDKITITFESLSHVSGEIIIAFTEDALKAIYGNLHHHEHTITYVSAGESGHFENYTCGCPHDHGAVPHYDEDIDLICDACGYDMNADYPPLVDTTISLRNLTRCEWLNELTAEDIAEIKIISGAVGVAPGNLNNVSSSTDEAVIARIFEEYYQLDARPISKMEGQIDGGGGVTVKFILKNGTAKELYINNGNYLDTNGDYFELNTVPKFKDNDNAIKAYGFTYGFFPYPVTGTVYDKDNNYVCEIPMDEFEFIVFDGDLPAVITGYYYTVDTGFGTLRFNYSSDLFYLDLYGEECNIDCYRLVGKNLDELIAEYTENSENGKEYSLTMNDKEWLYEDIGSSYKAGDTVTVKINLAIDMGYLFLVNGEEIATCRDVDGLYWEFTFTMPSADTVIDFKTYEGFLSDYNEAVLIEVYWKKHLDADYVSIRRYYGQLASGALVAMIDSGGYDQFLWEEIVGNVTFSYRDENRITVLYNNEFYTLEEAYAMGCITNEELTVIAELHNDR